MEFRLRHGERTFTVRVGPEPARASVDGGVHELARVAISPGAPAAGGVVVHEVTLEVDGRAHRTLVARAGDRILVALAGRVHVFDTGDAAPGTRRGGTRSGRVTAPMPGKVVRVLVAPGDAVETGAPVLVLEAMKMETTLVAEVTGRVTQVIAVAGAVVDGGALLVEIAPASR
ncbi:MAG TPA: biotin/lipoyl-containing protein [Candidatus Binatia bacterium]|nr:biotin/lipoyl-containing protein [Candidatus Binatia bacterium]